MSGLPWVLERVEADGLWKWELNEGRVLVDDCPRWHGGPPRSCDHRDDMEIVASARERIRVLVSA